MDRPVSLAVKTFDGYRNAIRRCWLSQTASALSVVTVAEDDDDAAGEEAAAFVGAEQGEVRAHEAVRSTSPATAAR